MTLGLTTEQAIELLATYQLDIDATLITSLCVNDLNEKNKTTLTPLGKIARNGALCCGLIKVISLPFDLLTAIWCPTYSMLCAIAWPVTVASVSAAVAWGALLGRVQCPYRTGMHGVTTLSSFN